MWSRGGFLWNRSSIKSGTEADMKRHDAGALTALLFLRNSTTAHQYSKRFNRTGRDRKRIHESSIIARVHPRAPSVFKLCLNLLRREKRSHVPLSLTAVCLVLVLVLAPSYLDHTFSLFLQLRSSFLLLVFPLSDHLMARKLCLTRLMLLTLTWREITIQCHALTGRFSSAVD